MDSISNYEKYRRICRKKVTFTLICIALLLVTLIISISVGFFRISFMDSLNVIIKCFNGEDVPRQLRMIVWEGRLPEALTAIVVGSALAVGGAVMQTMLRNPLAGPYTMGVSSGAAFGVSIAAILGLSVIPGATSNIAVIFNAFIFSLIPMGIILAVSRKGTMTPTKVILTGIAVMYLFSAITTVLMLSANDETLANVYAWRVGTLSRPDWSYLSLMSITTISGMMFLMANSRKYNVLMAGDECAKSLGVDPKRTTLVGMTVISLMTASVVCFTGTIGFIGLVGPHIARIFVGSDTKYLIPASAFFGALFLLCADCISRVVGSLGMPVGVVSALVGCPLFIIILIRMRSKEWA